jgi:hypothetical protein
VNGQISNLENVHRMLHNANDWAAIKKGTVQSYFEAIKARHFKTKLDKRMEDECWRWM